MSKFVTSAVLTLAVAGAVVPATTIVASANSHKELKTVKVGINSPSKTDQAVWKIVEKNGEKHGIKIKLVTFTDFNQPNAALKQESIRHQRRIKLFGKLLRRMVKSTALRSSW